MQDMLKQMIHREKHHLWVLLRAEYHKRMSERKILRAFVNKLLFLKANKGFMKWQMAYEFKRAKLEFQMRYLTELLVDAHKQRKQRKEMGPLQLRDASISMIQDNFRLSLREMKARH